MKQILSALILAAGVLKGSPDFFEMPPIEYSRTASTDEMVRFSREIAAGEWTAPSGGGKEFLRAVLQRLRIPVESQVLVFSKTSLQNSLINQGNPRALYFSPDAYVGWVPGGKVEVIVQDEKLGPVFYVLSPPVGDKAPVITRHTDTCLQCHANSRTEGVPGLLVRSVSPDENSHPLLSHGTTLVDYRTPVEKRWGGWYVSGSSDDPHLGNQSTTAELELEAKLTNLEDLSKTINTDKYLVPTSDIVALLVLEHQCRMNNLLTKARMNFQRSEWFQQSMQETLEIDQEKGMAWKSANQLADEVVEGLLFKDEVELAGDGVGGSGAFARAFVAAGVKTESDKSLRDFRLYARIFKYRCSYMIYSKAFKGLPPLVKERVLVKLRAALSEESDEKFNYLSSREKKSIRAILEETLPDFSGQ
ncbi:hypothetical protein V2O64_14575 [Verrucomicrobiaceae bacterium 227]